MITIAPQEGPQTKFLSTTADIAVYGGSAGGGKTFGLLLEPIRHYENPDFGGVIFRRNSVQIRNEGGLWDESMKIYGQIDGHPREHFLEWKFPSGMRMKFAGLEHEKNVLNWQGSQIPYIGWDELTHFTSYQFWYMLSRNRSTSGVPGYIRATCNPDVDSWVRELIDWWIGEDGYPIPERSGVIRWFIRDEDQIIWGDTKEELEAKYPPPRYIPKSFTFIASTIYDNKILMAADPGYLANLNAMARVERLRLLGGNWNVRATAGLIFQREWFEVIDTLPAGYVRVIRYWDKAATKPHEGNKDPDWTRGVKVYKYKDGSFVIGHIASMRDTPGNVEKFMRNTATQDGVQCAQFVEQEPGASGVADATNMVRLLQGFAVEVRKVATDKLTRALPASAQAEHGNIKVLRGPWNEAFFTEAENFDGSGKTGHDDQIDGLSGAINELSTARSILDVS